MNSFNFNDAVRFKLATQQEDTNAKIQVFAGVLLGVLLRWIYSVAVDVIRNQAPWCFGSWGSSCSAWRLPWSPPFSSSLGIGRKCRTSLPVCAFGMHWLTASPWMSS